MVPFKFLALLQQSCYQQCDVGVSFDKTPVEVCKSKEYLDVVYSPWFRPIDDSGDAFTLHGNSGWRDDVSQKTDFLNMELALLEFGKQAMFEELPKDLAYVFDVLGK